MPSNIVAPLGALVSRTGKSGFAPPIDGGELNVIGTEYN